MEWPVWSGLVVAVDVRRHVTASINVWIVPLRVKELQPRGAFDVVVNEDVINSMVQCSVVLGLGSKLFTLL